MDFYTNVQRYKNVIQYRGVENGKRIFYEERFSPELYRINPKSKENLITIDGQKVSTVHCKSMYEAGQYIKKNQTDDYIIHGNTNYICQYISNKFPEPRIEYDIDKLCVAYLDIETTCEDGFPDVERAIEQIIVLTMYNSLDKKYYVYCLNEIDGVDKVKKYRTDDPNVVVKYFDCEVDMLKSFMSLWRSIYPDIITGWYIKFFDIPYIINRMNRLIGPEHTKKLSPWEQIKEGSMFVNNREQNYYTIVGVETLDYLDVYKKFSMGNRSSYKLDYIANYELKRGKLSYEEHSQMHLFYKADFPKFVEYNIMDVELIVALEQKLQYLAFAVFIAYYAKVNYEKVLGSVAPIESICYNHLKQKNVVFPPRKQNFYKESIAGGFVKEPEPNIYRWAVSFDLNSLYPSIIMQQNMSPETLVQNRHKIVNQDELVNKKMDLSFLDKVNYTMNANGHFFKRDKRGFLPEIIENLYAERKANKSKMLECKIKIANKDYRNEEEKKQLEALAVSYHTKQYSQKILLNSIYGALANEYFAFFDPRIAEGVTLHGQFIIKWAERKINEYLNDLYKTNDVNYVIAIDTDSLYIVLDKLVEKIIPDGTDAEKVQFLDNVCQQKIEPFLEKSYAELADYTSAFENCMVMKRELIVSKGVWTAKKRYALNIYDKEGERYKRPQLYIKGLETERSSTPDFCREKLENSIKIFMNRSEECLHKYVRAVEKRYRQLPAGDIGQSKTANNIEKYTDSVSLFKKGCPIQVRASILYNHNIKIKDLDKKYQQIRSGDKMKYLYLKTPNPIKENVIGFIDDIPNELEAKEYIDYKENFNKTFLSPLDKIVSLDGWSVKPQPQSLDNFFV